MFNPNECAEDYITERAMLLNLALHKAGRADVHDIGLALTRLYPWQLDDLRTSYRGFNNTDLAEDVRARLPQGRLRTLLYRLALPRARLLAELVHHNARCHRVLTAVLCNTDATELAAARAFHRRVGHARSLTGDVEAAWCGCDHRCRFYRKLCCELLAAVRAPEATPVAQPTLRADLDALYAVADAARCKNGRLPPKAAVHARDALFIRILCRRSRLHLYCLQRECLLRTGRGLDRLVRACYPRGPGRHALLTLLASASTISQSSMCMFDTTQGGPRGGLAPVPHWICALPNDATPPPRVVAPRSIDPDFISYPIDGRVTPSGGLCRLLNHALGRSTAHLSDLEYLVPLASPYYRLMPAHYQQLANRSLRADLTRAAGGCARVAQVCSLALGTAASELPPDEQEL